CGIMGAAAAGPAQASILKFLTIEELSGASSLVVRARVTGQSVHWTDDGRGIYTQVDITVTSDLTAGGGRPADPPGRRLAIIQSGGEIDGISLDWQGRPRFHVGEDLVLFLAPYEERDPSDPRLLLVGGTQGRMRVIPGEPAGDPWGVQRDLRGVIDAPH